MAEPVSMSSDESLPLLAVNQYDEVDWEFAGWGTVTRMQVSDAEVRATVRPKVVHLLGQLRATAIAGNDITSSCFYTLGVAVQAAGIFAPISITLVALLLFFFRSIYGEVGTALPLNGGSYNCLLNSTSKFVASFAACLSILSYAATAVVSADSAMMYLKEVIPELPVMPATIAVLGIFALLVLLGISDSANVAAVMFVGHMSVMTTLLVWCIVYVIRDPSMFNENWHKRHEFYEPPKAIYFGFATALLGVSGFETSSNYIEEQAPGVFPKTLRNMWAITAVLNPTLSLLSVGILPLDFINANPNAVMAEMGYRASGNGKWLKYMVGIDAAVVLAASVLTAYVGVVGLMRRMAMDRCLPQFFNQVNPWRRTNHWIILLFFGTTSSLYGNPRSLGGVYTISFLSVMTLFALGNMLLKYKRSKLPRQVYASWPAVLLGLLGVLAGLIGNIVYTPEILQYFAIYFSVTVLLVMLMFARIRLLKFLLFFLKNTPCSEYCTRFIRRQIRKINCQQIIFFAKTDELPILNKAVLYVMDNELTNWMRIIRVYRTDEDLPPKMEKHVAVLDKIYPKCRIDLILVKGVNFSPEVVEYLAQRLGVSQNFMFITCPSSRFPHNYAAFGGVRVITH